MELSPDARTLVERLELEPHPEGGWYRETHRSPQRIPAAALAPGYGGARCAVTSILFLLPAGVRSRSHRVRSEEIFVHHDGDPLRLLMAEDERRLFETPTTQVVTLGSAAVYQAVVPGGWWQAAEVAPGPRGYALVGCIVAPGFEFADFEMAE